MMEATSTSETLINFYRVTRRNNPEDSRLQFSLVRVQVTSDLKEMK
jgi:hypothetical protein